METVYGNTHNIKSNHLKQLQQLYEQRQPGDRFVTVEFAQQIATLSTDIRQPICSYINRRGHVVRVAVGTPVQTQLAPSDLPQQDVDRLSGIRSVVAQSQAPDRATLLAMSWQRLDALVVIIPQEKPMAWQTRSAVGPIKDIHLVHLVPDLDEPWIVTPSISLKELTEQDFGTLIDTWDKEFQASDVEDFQVQQRSS